MTPTQPQEIPKRYNREIEKKWQQYWEEKGLFTFKLDDRPLYVIDTPPPFTSGKLHMGHVLSYSYIDFVARYKRMKGFNVLYPQGWDAQGFPTEVKVEKKYGRLPPAEFRKKCEEWSWEMIKAMREQMKAMGFSADWSREYITMLPEYHKLVQESIIEMWEKGHIYRDKHPVLWCPHCRSAIAKAETEEKEEDSYLNYFNFTVVENGEEKGKITIASTRPELLHACVAVIVHPEDERYKAFVGKKAKTPFGREVPIIADKEVDKEFGTGAVMLCTYGDKMDVVWQKRYNLPVIQHADERGRVINSGLYDGLTLKEAREWVINYLKEKGFMVKQEKIRHTLKIHDRCKHTIELLPSMEWFAKVRENADKIKAMAKEIEWVPDFGIHYLTDWLDNIDWDWVISRDRIFGTPIPFYVCECGHVEPAKELPFYPEKAPPKTCPKCGREMKPEKKVLDVWVDSSITPLVVSGWKQDEELFKKAYPTQLRPQGVEIVRTWAFYTIYRSGVALTGKKPWDTILLNGNVLAPDGKKMSKSLGNVIDPMELMKEYPVDAIRQWAAMSGAMAKDRPFSYEDLKYAKQFLNKLWNIYRFTAPHIAKQEVSVQELPTIERGFLSRLSAVIKEVSEAMERYDFRRAIITLQHFTWYEVADYYIEYAKPYLYEGTEEEKRARIYTLRELMKGIITMLYPFTPHIAEEIYAGLFGEKESLQLERWPSPRERDEQAEEILRVANEVARAVRDYKARNRLSQKERVAKVTITTPVELPQDVLENLMKTLHIGEIEVREGELKVEIA